MLFKLNNLIAKIKSQNKLNELIKSVDLNKFEHFQKKYKYSSPFPGYSKYLDIRYWMEVKLKEYYRLELDKSKQKLRILDIGTGAGYFPYVCNYFGHKSKAIDLGDIPMYNDITKFLKIERIDHEIKAYQNLPLPEEKFDFITAFSICFNNHHSSALWNENEWNFFLKDLAINYADKNCKLLLVLNPEWNLSGYSASLIDFFRKHGAEVHKSRIFFKNLECFVAKNRSYSKLPLKSF